MESFRGMANQVAKAQSTGATGHTDANVDRICKALHESRIVGTSALERLNVFGARLAIGVSQIDQDYAELRRDLAPILALHELHYWSTAEIASQNGANKMTFHYLGLNALGRAVARRATSYLAEVAAP
jgi:hypothetical protein